MSLLREELAALRPPDGLSVSEWADKWRILDPRYASEPGQWSTGRVPHSREIMDAASDPNVREITFQKGTQIAGTEILLNILGWIIDQNPGPTLVVVPKSDLIKVFNYGRFAAMVQSNPRVLSHVLDERGAWTERRIEFDRMLLYFASAEVPSDLASNPIRYLLCDELDKWPRFSGNEADPLSLARERTQTYYSAGDSKIFKTTTPVLDTDYMSQEFAASDQRRYHVPCPLCGHYQVLIMDRVRWGEERDARKIEEQKLAWYECEKCSGTIRDHEKWRPLQLGKWVPADAKIDDDTGEVTGKLDSEHRGYHLSALYSPWRTWSQAAATFLRAQQSGDPGKLMNFRNSWEGVPWVEIVRKVTPDRIATLVAPRPAGVVPIAARYLTAAVDVQGGVSGEFYVTVRAWGVGYSSWLIQTHVMDRWADLSSFLLGAHWLRGTEPVRINLALIDSNYRTDEVWEFCRDHEEFVRPIKGEEILKSGAYFTSSYVERKLDGKAFGLMLWRLNTNLLKDKLNRLQGIEPGTPGYWEIHAEPRGDYLKHLVAEHKVLVRDKRKDVVVQRWRPKSKGSPNHFYDTEVYCLAAAEMLQVYALGGEQEVGESASAAATPVAGSEQRSGPSWLQRDRGSWMGGSGAGAGGKSWVRG